VILVFLLIVVTLTGCEVKPPPDITDPGQLLYLGYTKKKVNCARCHGAEGQGGPDAPAIQQAAAKHDSAKLADIIINGKGLGPEAMPPLDTQLTPRELQQLLTFLKTLQDPSILPNR